MGGHCTVKAEVAKMKFGQHVDYFHPKTSNLGQPFAPPQATLTILEAQGPYRVAIMQQGGG